MVKIERKYVLIINGHEQQSILPFETYQRAMACIREWVSDGRLKEQDEIQIKKIEETTFTLDYLEIKESQV